MIQNTYQEWLESFDPKDRDFEHIVLAEQRRKEAIDKFDDKARRIYRLAVNAGGVVAWIKQKKDLFIQDPRRQKVLEYSLSHFEALEEYEKCHEIKKGLDYLEENQIGFSSWK